MEKFAKYKKLASNSITVLQRYLSQLNAFYEFCRNLDDQYLSDMETKFLQSKKFVEWCISSNGGYEKKAIRECQMGIRDELFISQSKIQCNNFLKQNLIKFKILPQLFSKCVLHKYKIFIYGSFLKRTCYSYHTLKNEYKLICKYPSDIAPFFRYMYVFVNDIILFFGDYVKSSSQVFTLKKQLIVTHKLHKNKEEYDALIMIINGYGDEEDVLVTSEGNFIPINEIRSSFDCNRINSLKDCPKIFIIDVCRGNV
ncbi:hypothetical protein RFI_35117, partial [Reticulomyxa filosa]